jgi:hypothetical protein
MRCSQARSVIPQTLTTRPLWIRLVRENQRCLSKTYGLLLYTSDLPSALPLSRLSRGPKQRCILSVERPQNRMKGMGKTNVDGFDSVDVDASWEDAPWGGSRLSDLEFL